MSNSPTANAKNVGTYGLDGVMSGDHPHVKGEAKIHPPSGRVKAVDDKSNGTAMAEASSYGAAGIIDSSIDFGGHLDVKAHEMSKVVARATTQDGSASADAGNDLDGNGVIDPITNPTFKAGIQKTGGIINTPIGEDGGVGGDLGLDVDALNITRAVSEANHGHAHSHADEKTVYGVLNSDITVNGSLTGYKENPEGSPATVDVVDKVVSKATTGDSSSGYEANASSERLEVTGMRFGQDANEAKGIHKDVGSELNVHRDASLDVNVGTTEERNRVRSIAEVHGHGDANATVSVHDNYGITGITGGESISINYDSNSTFRPQTLNYLNIGLDESYNADHPLLIKGFNVVGPNVGTKDVQLVISLTELSESPLDLERTKFPSKNIIGKVLKEWKDIKYTPGTLQDIQLPTELKPDGPRIDPDSTSPKGSDQYNYISIRTNGIKQSELSIQALTTLPTPIFQGANIYVGGHADIKAEVANKYRADASSYTGDATAVANTSGGSGSHFGYGETVGIDAYRIAAKSGELEGKVDNRTRVNAHTHHGGAKATSVSGVQSGLRSVDTDIYSGPSSLTGSVSNVQRAYASSSSDELDQDSGSRAKVKSDLTIGVETGHLDLHQATIHGSAEVKQVADSHIHGGDASSETETKGDGDVIGFKNSGGVTVSGDLTVNAKSRLDLSSRTKNVDVAKEVDATAKVDGDVFGMEMDKHVSATGALYVDAGADVDLYASAKSHDSNVKAKVEIEDNDDEVIAARFRGDVSVHHDATFKGTTDVKAESSAKTTYRGKHNDGATAEVKFKGDIGGLEFEEKLQVQGSSELSGKANVDVKATADLHRGDAKAKVGLKNEGNVDVYGVLFNGSGSSREVELKSGADITGSAQLKSQATATSHHGKATAEVIHDDEVTGIEGNDKTDLAVTGKLTSYGSAIVNGEATATTHSGKAKATAKQEGNVVGFEWDDDIHVTGHSHLSGTGKLGLRSKAHSDEDNATAVSQQRGRDDDGDADTNGLDIKEGYTVHGNSVIDGKAQVRLHSEATSQAGNAKAEAKADEEVDGVEFDGNEHDVVRVYGNSTITGRALTKATAQATSMSGTAEADVEADKGSGIDIDIDNDGVDFKASENANFEAVNRVKLEATARTHNAYADYDHKVVDASIETEEQYGLTSELDEMKNGTDFEAKNLYGTGRVKVTGDAIAYAMKAENADNSHDEVDAKATTEITRGINLAQFEVFGTTNLKGRSTTDMGSHATAKEGNTDATTELNKDGFSAGIYIDEEIKNAGKATLDGRAHTTARATSESYRAGEGVGSGSSTAEALDKEGTVGVYVGSSTEDKFGNTTADITGHGSSTTIAYASHMGDENADGNAIATARQGDDESTQTGSVRGVTVFKLKSQSEASLTGTAKLDDTAHATTVDGRATANAGSKVGAIGVAYGVVKEVGSDLSVYGESTAKANSYAESGIGNVEATSYVGIPGTAPPASGNVGVLSFADSDVHGYSSIEGKATSHIGATSLSQGANPSGYTSLAKAFISNTGGVISFGKDTVSAGLDLYGTATLNQAASAMLREGVAAQAIAGTDSSTDQTNLLDPRKGSNVYGVRLVGDKSSHGEGSIHGTAKGYLSATSHITTDVDGGSTSIYKFDPNTDSYAYSGFASAQGIQITGNNVPHTARDAFGDAHVTLGSGYDHEIKAVTPGSLNGFAYINSEASTTATTGNAVSASGNVYRVESVVPSPSYEAYTPISNVFTPSPETGVGNSTGVLGINLDGDVTINGPSDIQGRAQVGYMTEEGEVIAGNVASSYTHTGDAQASADLDQVIGISTSAGRELDQGAHPPMTAKIVGVSDINLNGNSTIFAQGFAVNHASAHSTTGSDPYVGGSSADSGTERTIGLDLLAGRINVHGDLHLESRAYSNDTSEASSVHGIALSNASGALGTAAILGGLGLASDPKYPEQDLAPSIDISANATSFEAHATSYDSAYSETYTGNAIAAAGFELLLDGGSGAHTNGYPDISFFPLVATAGVFDTDIAIHGNATHGIAISGYRNDVAEAQTTTGNALAGAGYAFNGDGYFDMYGTTPFTIVPTAYSFGASGSDIIVRGDVGTLEEAEGGLRLHSGAHGSASAHTGYGIAYANVSEATIGYQTNDFLQDRSEYPSQISIGSGDIQIVAQIDSVNAQAFSGSGDGSSEDFSVTVGGNHVSIPSFDALASVQGTAIGAGTWADDVLARSGSMVPGDPTVASIQNSPLQISITGNGDIDVHGQILGGQASASGTTADVRAKAGLNAFGLQMIDDFNPHEEDRSSVSIGGTGDLSASASIGSSEQAFSVSANTVYGAATAINDGGNAFPFMYVGGILGFDLEHPGPGSGQVSVKDGDITATGYANVATSSTTHGGGDSTASNIANVFGIAETDILGGQTSGSSVSGKGIGEFTTIASNTTGNATASSTVNGAGIIGDGVSIISGGALSSNPNTLSVNGNIEGIAHISNTVMAHTVYGNATATATGGAVGISGMDISSTGGGVLSGIASNTQVAMASSIYSESMD